MLAGLRVGLGGEEGVEDAVEVLGGDTRAGVADFEDHKVAGAVGAGAERKEGVAYALHGVACVEHEVEDDLLELALVAVDAREVGVEPGFEPDAGGFEGVFEEDGGVMEELVEVDGDELGGGGAGEVEQAVDDLGGAEGLLGDLLKDRGEAGGELGAGAELLGEHLGVAGDDGERSVDLVGYSGGQEADRGELFRLGELGFELDAIGDVVDLDDAAYDVEVTGEEGGDGDVGGADFAGGEGEAELVEGLGAVGVDGFAANLAEAVEEVWWEDLGERAADGFGAGAGEEDLHLRVPGLDGVVEVYREDADVDGLDDILIEILQSFELVDLRFE